MIISSINISDTTYVKNNLYLNKECGQLGVIFTTSFDISNWHL